MALREGGYGQYCPISRAVEVLGERWTMLIVRDLLVGKTRFNDLARGLPRLSRSLLSKRLQQLERAGIVERADSEYHLTLAGRELHDVVFGIGAWGAKWQFGDPRDDELDPQVLLWWVHDRLDLDRLPDRRVVLEFSFRDDPFRAWIVRDDMGPSLCMSQPDFDVDVVVRSDLRALYRVWLGRTDLTTALRDGSVELLGPPSLVRAMPNVLMLSPVASLVAGARG